MAAIDFPAGPVVDQNFTASNGNKYTWTGAVWRPADPSGGGGGAATYIGDTAPGSPTDGQLWWESDSGQSYIRYNDGTSAQWVAFSIGAQGPAGPSGQWVQITQAAYDALSPPDPGTLYVVIG